MDYEQNR
ncbi:Protein of unknown function [Weissella confusa LBAE C39-2]|nr:Protein of unknown function [Weissella confusa LBAE C39-2]